MHRRHPCDTGRLGPRHVEAEIVTPCPTCYGFVEDHPGGCPTRNGAGGDRFAGERHIGPFAALADAVTAAVQRIATLDPALQAQAVELLPRRHRRIAAAALALLAPKR